MTRTLITVLAATILATACTSTSPLRSPSGGATAISGTLTRHLFEPHALEIWLDGQRYRGSWKTSAPSRAQVAAAAYPHRKQLGRVVAVLKSDAGSELNCQWETRGSTARGSCTDGRQSYPLRLH